MIRLFDTALGRTAELTPRAPGEVSMYICGPTVYDVPHLGHGRFSLVFDVLRRYLSWCGLRVTYVSNVTDIDDKIIQRAAERGCDPADLAREFEDVWYETMAAIGVERPDHDPHATAYVDQMIALIADLVARDAAYVTSTGVYFLVDSVDDYGLLARQSVEDLRSGARVGVDDEKRSPLDFALWKLAKPGEPSWDSPWGPGRPGWNTECVVMSLDVLGDGFDLHGGGLDLAFPHHENERAQAVAAGRVFATRWMHNGFVEVDGEKMSKSLGNYESLADVLEHHDARAYRLLVLQAHYRSPIEITAATFEAADASLHRLDAFARRTASLPTVEPDAAAVERFRAVMDDDLDTPQALALVFELVRRANQELDAGDEAGAATSAATVGHLCRAFGLELRGEADEIPAGVSALAAARDAARARRDFSEADRLRDELETMGWIVEDSASGTQLRRP